jgi:CDP-glycerol glycerophosphotransferase (TagB/SpsB family)
MFQYVGNSLWRSLIQALDWLVPSRHQIVIHTFPDGDDQGVALCRGLMTEQWSGCVVWLTNDAAKDFNAWAKRRGLSQLEIRFVKKDSLKGVVYYTMSRWAFHTHGLFGSRKRPPRKLSIYMGHGMPVKVIWKGIAGSHPPIVTHLLSTSPLFTDAMMRAGGYQRNQFIEAGLPRNEMLTSKRSELSDFVQTLRGGAECLIMFMPTYRRSKIGFITTDGVEGDNALGLQKPDLVRLGNWLALNKCKLLVKPHPMSVHSGKDMRSDDGTWEIFGDSRLFATGVGLYELLGAVDLLITDVSSIYVDFLALDKPIIFYFPDQQAYAGSRGFLLQPFESFVPGPIVASYTELEVHLARWRSGCDDYREKRRLLKEQMNPRLENSVRRVFEAVGINGGRE